MTLFELLLTLTRHIYHILIFSLTTRTLCSSNSPSAIVSACADKEIITDTPVSILKSIKNETEIKGMLEANIRSALCHSRLLKWAEDNADTGMILTDLKTKLKTKWLRNHVIYSSRIFDSRF